MNQKSVNVLADIVVFNKYAKFLPELGRRENWEEIVIRNMRMHQARYPQIAGEIGKVYQDFVLTKKVLPSMRSLQFGGRPIEMAENRIFNCAYMPAESYKFFSELMFLLLGGTGVGYSVQRRHTAQLPEVSAPKSIGVHKFQVQDSIIGWADTIKVVAKAFLHGGALPAFDYRDIREKGTELVTTGGKAPGPEPLKICVDRIIAVFRHAIDRKLEPIEVHDIACSIADSVRAGGIRRAAMICLFDRDDHEMLSCKALVPVHVRHLSGVKSEDGSGLMTWEDAYGTENTGLVSAHDRKIWADTSMLPWYMVYPARGRSNNSAVLPRGKVSKYEFQQLMRKVEASGCGEPGIYWTNNEDWGTNPCCEIALRPYQMCNLTEINAGAITDQTSFNKAAKAAAYLGTLQAGYTDFHYLNPKWKEACESEALLGVSMTGIASGTLDSLSQTEAAAHAKLLNKHLASKIKINPAARVTCVKPAGTTSLVLGTSSGIHAWHAPYYIRRMRAGRDEELAKYMTKAAPDLVEDDVTDPKQVVLSFPQKAPEGAIMRDEDMFSLLERVKAVSTGWVASGHSSGDNQHNVSCTISVKSDEWAELTTWMWENRDHYNGISVLPFFGSTAYPQMPFEDITKEQYEAMLPLLKGIDISQVFEDNGDGVDLAGEAACAGGACELQF